MYNIYLRPHLFKNVFQYQTAKFSNAKLQLLLHQTNNQLRGLKIVTSKKKKKIVTSVEQEIEG